MLLITFSTNQSLFCLPFVCKHPHTHSAGSNMLFNIFYLVGVVRPPPSILPAAGRQRSKNLEPERIKPFMLNFHIGFGGFCVLCPLVSCTHFGTASIRCNLIFQDDFIAHNLLTICMTNEMNIGFST